MERIGDILQGVARQRSRNDSSPLVLWHPLAANEGARVSHVPISQHLSHAWIKLTGDPFRPHQSLALTTLRRGDGIALSGGGAAGAATARLLLFELLRAESGTTALILLPDLEMAHDQVESLQPLNAELGNHLTIATVGPGGNALHAAHARVILTTPDIMHGRLLRFHDRIWKPFLHGLRAVWLDEAHTYTGVAAAHLGALLLRGSRLRHEGNSPLQFIATLAEVADAETTLHTIWPATWRLVPVDDAPTPARALAVWRSGAERLRDASMLTQALVRAGYRTHLLCAPLDEQAMRQLVGDDTELLTVGTNLRPAQVQLLVGFPISSANVRRALASGAEATVLMLGDQPCDTMLARLPATLLHTPLPAWPVPPSNGYVTLQHMLCAANERPVTQGEVEHWGAQAVVERLEGAGQLVALPGSEPAWQPRAAPTNEQAPDPYGGFGLRAAGGPPTLLLDEGGHVLDQFDTAAFDRWGFPGAVLPPGGCRYRVTSRDEQQSTLTLKPEVGGRRTHPLRRCEVKVRDEQEHRSLRGGRTLARGRVLVHEEIYGYREAKPGNTPTERTLSPSLSISWSSSAIWIDVGITPATNGQVVGWSLVQALPLLTLSRFTDLVPMYDVESRRLFLVDAQPGGNGVSAWVYAHLEELLPLAYDIALDCRNDPLMEPMARADMDWLLLLLGGEGQTPSTRERQTAISADQSVYINKETTAPAVRVPAPVSRREPPTPPAPPSPGQPTATRPASRQEPPAASVPPPPGQPAATRPASRQEPPATAERSAPAPTTAEPAPSSGKKSRARGGSDGRKSRQNTGSRKESAARNGAAPQDAQPPAAPSRVEKPLPEPVLPLDDDPLPPLPQTPPAAPAPAQPPLPDASAMIARMRQLRQKREQDEPKPTRPQPQQRNGNDEPRFHAGDTIFCLPYGEGEVRASRIEDEVEILEVEFPEYGSLTIDPAVSLVRLVKAAQTEEEDLL